MSEMTSSWSSPFSQCISLLLRYAKFLMIVVFTLGCDWLQFGFLLLSSHKPACDIFVPQHLTGKLRSPRKHLALKLLQPLLPKSTLRFFRVKLQSAQRCFCGLNFSQDQSIFKVSVAAHPRSEGAESEMSRWKTLWSNISAQVFKWCSL